MAFSQLGLNDRLVQGILATGYTAPTAIQAQAIPFALQGRDIIGCAQTGTGKTAAFALPLLQLLETEKDRNQRKSVRALILAPTRELVAQISEEFKNYGRGLDLKLATIYGGVSQGPQTKALQRGADIIVAAPGRLLDLMQQGFIHLDRVEYLVLDEADRMLDMGFINDIRKVIAKIPAKRQTLLFSATASTEIRKLAAALLNNPSQINLSPDAAPPILVSQSVYHVKKENKKHLLTHVLEDDSMENVLIFTRTKHGADKVVKDLVRNGVKAQAIHGNKSQSARDKALKDFKNRSIRVLVATDVASRGIDVERLSHVINYEIPEQAETYVHRIGRTGRAGVTGAALSFCSSDEKVYLKNIHKLIKTTINVVSTHPFATGFNN